MGVIVNAVSNIPTMPLDFATKSKVGSNMELGSKVWPVGKESQNLIDGIV